MTEGSRLESCHRSNRCRRKRRKGCDVTELQNGRCGGQRARGRGGVARSGPAPDDKRALDADDPLDGALVALQQHLARALRRGEPGDAGHQFRVSVYLLVAMTRLLSCCPGVLNWVGRAHTSVSRQMRIVPSRDPDTIRLSGRRANACTASRWPSRTASRPFPARGGRNSIMRPSESPMGFRHQARGRLVGCGEE